MIRSSPSIGIGITTRNRWDDLAVTLAHLKEEGLDQLQTIVMDDGSDHPVPADFAQRFPWVRFERYEKSEGVTVGRNRLARLLTTEFYLSIDDDSFPVAGDLEKAARWISDRPKVSALAFGIIFRKDELPDPAELERPPQLVKDFVGCAAMFRRELFLELGGFEHRLYFYHEEPEYCFRTFEKGYDTYTYPGVVVRHMVTPVFRHHGSRTRYFMRNIVLLDLWFYPHPHSFLRAIGHLPLLFIRLPKLRPYWWPFTLGWAEGFFCYPKWRQLKPRFTMEQYREWKTRPVAGEVCVDTKTPL